MLTYRQVNNTASHFTHYAAEADALADFEFTVTGGCCFSYEPDGSRREWRPFEIEAVRNLIRIHYGTGKRAGKIVFDDSPVTPQERGWPVDERRACRNHYPTRA